MPSRLVDLARFARYALRFERAYKSDQWNAVRASFADHATYEIVGTGTPYDGVVHGGAAIVDFMHGFVDAVDRKYDRRQPRLLGLPRFDGHVIVLDWSVRYVRTTSAAAVAPAVPPSGGASAGGQVAVIITGTSRVRFERGVIVMLHDTMHADECARWLAGAAG